MPSVHGFSPLPARAGTTCLDPAGVEQRTVNRQPLCGAGLQFTTGLFPRSSLPAPRRAVLLPAASARRSLPRHRSPDKLFSRNLKMPKPPKTTHGPERSRRRIASLSDKRSLIAHRRHRPHSAPKPLSPYAHRTNGTFKNAARVAPKKMNLKNKPMRKFHFSAAPQDKAAYVMSRGIVGQFAAATEGGPYASANLPLVTCVDGWPNSLLRGGLAILRLAGVKIVSFTSGDVDQPSESTTHV